MEDKPALVVSACLLGVPCNHRAEANTAQSVLGLRATHRLVTVCPEVMGGLPTPRPPAELQADGSVRTAEGIDLTEAYRRGAQATVALARATQAVGAVLKARSPSCGCHQIYDGTFSRRTVAGEGVTARALREAGVSARSEEDVAASGGWV